MAEKIILETIDVPSVHPYARWAYFRTHRCRSHVWGVRYYSVIYAKDTQDSEWSWRGSCAAGVKWSFEFERASWCWPLRWHSSSLGQWMSEFFMEQPETVETNESKRTSIKGFQIITDSSSRRKELTTSSMVISHWNVFFFSFFFFPFPRRKRAFLLD